MSRLRVMCQKCGKNYCVNKLMCSECSRKERKRPRVAYNKDKLLGDRPRVVRKSNRLIGKSPQNTEDNIVENVSEINKPPVLLTTSKKASTSRKHRLLYKKTIKPPYPCSIPITCDHLFFRGICYQIGDIVSVRDSEDGQQYYAQIRGFLDDQYCEKSAVITWLLPSSASSDGCFDPATYFLGPEEDKPRKLEYMQFVCHAPSDYYRNPYAPFPTVTLRPETGFIWTHADHRVPIGLACKLSDCKNVATSSRFEMLKNVKNK